MLVLATYSAGSFGLRCCSLSRMWLPDLAKIGFCVGCHICRRLGDHSLIGLGRWTVGSHCDGPAAGARSSSETSRFAVACCARRRGGRRWFTSYRLRAAVRRFAQLQPHHLAGLGMWKVLDDGVCQPAVSEEGYAYGETFIASFSNLLS